MMKKAIILASIMILGITLRFYSLGTNPPSLDWDEASLGYNAYSLLKTGKDEFARKLPVSLRSFEDYKPALYSYVAIPGILVYGLNEVTTRLPSGVFGSLTIVVVYLLVEKLYGTKVGLIAALLFAISPWHIQFSRVAFEANISLFFVVLCLFAFISAQKNSTWFMVAGIAIVLALYSYHSPRLVLPLIFTGWAIYFRNILYTHKKIVIIVAVLSLLLLTPFLKEMLTSGGARLSSVSIIRPGETLEKSIQELEYDINSGNPLGAVIHNRRLIYTKSVVKGYLDHFNFDFLFLKGDDPGRHHAVDFGLLYLWEAPFIVYGIFSLLKQTHNRFPVFWWFLMAPVASSFTTGTPHAVRSLISLPLYQIFAAYGILSVFRKMFTLGVHFRLTTFAGVMVVFSGLIINMILYLDLYFIHTPIEYSIDWQYGYKEVVKVITPYVEDIDRIIITYKYDQPHIYVMFYTPIDPEWYQSQIESSVVMRFDRRFGKYSFRFIDWEKDKELKNTIIVGTPKEIPDLIDRGIKIKDVAFMDGTIAFRIIKL